MPSALRFEPPQARIAATGGASARSAGWPRQWWQALVTMLAWWAIRAQQRRQLLNLDAVQLRDIGIDPWQALREGQKPFWRT